MKAEFYNPAKGERFTPEAVTLNGVEGAIWTKYDLQHGRWQHEGKKFFPEGATRNEIIEWEYA